MEVMEEGEHSRQGSGSGSRGVKRQSSRTSFEETTCDKVSGAYEWSNNQPFSVQPDNDVNFVGVTKLCNMIFEVPHAFVGLLNANSWPLSFGFSPDPICNQWSSPPWALLPPDFKTIVVQDTLNNAMFSSNRFVQGPPYIRFYAACPLLNEQAYLGSLCIMDVQPRVFEVDSQEVLSRLANAIARELQKAEDYEMEQQTGNALVLESKHLYDFVQNAQTGIMLCETSIPSWPILFVNDAWSKISNIKKTDLMENGFWNMVQLDEAAADASQVLLDIVQSATTHRQTLELLVYHKNRTDDCKALSLRFCSITSANINAVQAASERLDNHGSDSSLYLATLQSCSESSGPLCGFVRFLNKPTPIPHIILDALLGRGEQAAVYKGSWNDAVVAIKIQQFLIPLTNYNLVSFHSTEFMVSDCFSHPHLIQGYGSTWHLLELNSLGACAEHWCILEYCDKGSLSTAIQKGCFNTTEDTAALNVLAILATAIEIAGAMSFLHAFDIIHGALDSNHVMLTTSDKDSRGFTAKVNEVSLQRKIDSLMSFRMKNEPQNTRESSDRYIAQKVISEVGVSQAGDVHAFGMLLLETCMTDLESINAETVDNGNLDNFFASQQKKVPVELQHLIARCLLKNVNERPTFPTLLRLFSDIETNWEPQDQIS